MRRLSDSSSWRHAALALLLVLFAACGDDGAATDGASSGGASKPPNVVIWMVDTLRADRLSAYGYERPTSPNFEALAADGVLFEDFHAHSNWTQPSVSSLLSGLHPVRYGGRFTNSVPDELLLAPEWFAEHGYATAGFTVSVAVAEVFGFAQGYELYEELDNQEATRDRKRRSGALYDADRLVERTRTWLDGEWDGERPFFLYLHSVDPHMPQEVHEDTPSWHDPDYAGRLDGSVDGLTEHKPHVDEADRRWLSDVYDGEVAFNDHWFGELRAALEERGLTDDTLVVVVSDHGEELWDRVTYGHGHKNLHAEMTHVPLIMSWPGGLPRGRRVAGLTRGVDLMPTVLDVIGLPALPASDGASLRPWLEAQLADDVRVERDDADLFLMRAQDYRDLCGLRNEDWLFTIDRAEREQLLFDLGRDPEARRDVGGELPGERASMTRRITVHLRDVTERAESLKARESAAPDAETTERLKALGYVGDEEPSAAEPEPEDLGGDTDDDEEDLDEG